MAVSSLSKYTSSHSLPAHNTQIVTEAIQERTTHLELLLKSLNTTIDKDATRICDTNSLQGRVQSLAEAQSVEEVQSIFEDIIHLLAFRLSILEDETLHNVRNDMMKWGKHEFAYVPNLAISYRHPDQPVEIAKVWLSIESFKKSLEILDSMGPEEEKFWQKLRVLKKITRSKRPEEALKIAESYPPSWKEKAHNIAGVFYARQGDISTALRCIEPTSYDTEGYKSDALCEVVLALIKEGSLPKAREIADAMPQDLFKERALNLIAINLGANGDPEKALELTRTTSDAMENYKSIALFTIVTALIKEDEVEGALAMASLIPNVCEKEKALNHVATHLANTGYSQRALELIQTTSNDYENDKPSALLAAVIALIKDGELEVAHKVANTIPGIPYLEKARALELVEDSYRRQGNSTHADSIRDTIPRRPVARSLFPMLPLPKTFVHWKHVYIA
jgi:tetratricopeptide (TPR) repeat protein